MSEIDISEEAVERETQDMHGGIGFAGLAILQTRDLIIALRTALTAAEAERDEALGRVAALRKAADDYYNHATCDVSEQMAKEDALQDALDDTAAAAREWEARVVERALDNAHRIAALTGERYGGAPSSEVTDAICAALRAEAARVREGR